MLASLLAAALLSQQPTDSGFFRPRDKWIAAGAVAATAATAIVDERIARFSRTPRVQGDSSRHDLVSRVTVINEVPLGIAAVGTFAIGRVAGWGTVADVGLHWTESLLSTQAIASALRVGLSRGRPREYPDDAFNFKPGRGLTNFDHRAWPSLHAAASFATAASLAEEIRMRNPRASRFATPLLYTAASIPGFTRVYLDQHWASDVVAGTALGAYMGVRMTRYLHGRRTRFDRWLLGATVLPTSSGLAAAWRTTF